MRRPDEIFPHRNRPNLLHLLRLRIVLAVVPTRVADGNVQSVAQQFAGLLYVGPHVTLPGGPQEQFSADYLWCGRGDLNPHASRRHPLKVVCLPIPPLPHGATTVFAGGAKNAVVAKQDCFCDKLLSRRTAFASGLLLRQTAFASNCFCGRRETSSVSTRTAFSVDETSASMVGE